MRIRPMRPADADLPGWSGRRPRELRDHGADLGGVRGRQRPDHHLVAVDDDGTVLGWVAVSPVSSRAVYAGVVEHSVYVHPTAQGAGVDAALLDALIASTEAAGIWTIQSGIFPENVASLALHRWAGFRIVGVRERIDRHRDTWRDVIAIQRRSPTVT